MRSNVIRSVEKGYLRKFRMSRIAFREYAHKG
ncbi:hypothetical protein [Bacillus sp. NTK071]